MGWTRAAAVVLAVLAMACSAPMRTPPDNYSPENHGRPDCDERGNVLQALDGVGAVAGVAIGAGAWRLSYEDTKDVAQEQKRELRTLGTASLVVAAAYISAIVVSVQATKRCKKANKQWDSWR